MKLNGQLGNREMLRGEESREIWEGTREAKKMGKREAGREQKQFPFLPLEAHPSMHILLVEKPPTLNTLTSISSQLY